MVSYFFGTARGESLQDTTSWVYWTYPHFIRYLRTMIYKLTPEPHKVSLRILAAVEPMLTTGVPTALPALISTPPATTGPGRTAREIANCICEVAAWWARNPGVAANAAVYAKAAAVVRSAEQAALHCFITPEGTHRGAASSCSPSKKVFDHPRAIFAGITPEGLMLCAIEAHAGDVSADQRDAAMAAMTAGYFELAWQIVTNTVGEVANG